MTLITADYVTAVAEIRDLHVKDERWGCGAISLEGLLLRHSNDGPRTPPSPPTAGHLKCTKPSGHDGLHRDGNCCWTPHKFTEDATVRYEPIDWSMCSCGTLYTTCPEAAIIDRLGLRD